MTQASNTSSKSFRIKSVKPSRNTWAIPSDILFSLLNENKKTETSCIALKDDQQKVIDDPKAVSEIFNHFFTNIGKNLSIALPPLKQILDSI